MAGVLALPPTLPIAWPMVPVPGIPITPVHHATHAPGKAYEDGEWMGLDVRACRARGSIFRQRKRTWEGICVCVYSVCT